jgi:hypothetical protein
MQVTIERQSTCGTTAPPDISSSWRPTQMEESLTLPVEMPSPRPGFVGQRKSEKSATLTLNADEVRVAFLSSVEHYSSVGDHQKGVSLVFQHIDRLLRKGTDEAFGQVDTILTNVNVTRLSPDIIGAFLAITFHAKTRLNAWVRAKYVARAVLALQDKKIDDAEIADLMHRYS